MSKTGSGPSGGQAGFLGKHGKFVTCDPAEHESSTDTIIIDLLKHYLKQLSKWEITFLSDIYSNAPLSRKQHIKVNKIKKRIEKLNSPPVDVAAGSST